MGAPDSYFDVDDKPRPYEWSDVVLAQLDDDTDNHDHDRRVSHRAVGEPDFWQLGFVQHRDAQSGYTHVEEDLSLYEDAFMRAVALWHVPSRPDTPAHLPHTPVESAKGKLNAIILLSGAYRVAGIDRPLSPLDKSLELLGDKLTKLPQDWNDAGARRIQRSTFERARVFVISANRDFAQRAQKPMPVPELLPVADGSIDVLWRNAEFKLLVNVPEEGAGDFFGKTPSGAEFKGPFLPDQDQQDIVTWLIARG